MKWTMFVLMALTLLSRFIGLGREMTLAYFYGASRISDAFLIAQSVPALFMSFAVAGIGTGFIPAYRQEEQRGLEKGFSTQVFVLTGMVALGVFGLLSLFLPAVLRFLAGGFDAEAMALALYFARISIWGVFFMGWSSFFGSWLQVREKVILASLVGIPFNIVTIAFIMLSARYELWLLAVGGVLAVGAQALYLFVLARRLGFGLRFGAQGYLGLRQMLFMAVPVIIGDSVQQIDIMVDKAIGSTFGVGAVSALAYAGRAMTAVEGIFITSVLTVFYPAIAKMAVVRELEGVKKELRGAVVGVSLFLVPAVFGIMVLSQPLVELLFMRGAFGQEEAAVTAGILFFYVAALLGRGLQTLFSRVFFSIGNSRVPMAIAIGSVALNIVLNVVLSQVIGLVGLALSNAITAFLGLFFMIQKLKKAIGGLGLGEILLPLGKIVGASSLMAVAAFLGHRLLAGYPLLVAVGAAVVLGAGVYLALMVKMRVIPRDLISKLQKRR